MLESLMCIFFFSSSQYKVASNVSNLHCLVLNVNNSYIFERIVMTLPYVTLYYSYCISNTKYLVLFILLN